MSHDSTRKPRSRKAADRPKKVVSIPFAPVAAGQEKVGMSKSGLGGIVPLGPTALVLAYAAVGVGCMLPTLSVATLEKP